MMPRYLSTDEVHALLGGHVGTKRLREAARRHGAELGVKRHGRHLIWDRERLEAYLDRQFAQGGRLVL